MTSDDKVRFPSVTSELLDRYLAGECLPNERFAVDQWLRSDPQNAIRLSAARHAFAHQIAPSPGNALEQLRRGLYDRMHAGQAVVHDVRVPSVGTPSIRARSGPRRLTGAMALALGFAAVAVIVGLGVRQRGRSDTVAPAIEHRYATADGQRATIRLADGTRVTIGPRTTLEVAAHFGTTDRAVSLTGEAQFDVTHAQAPFMVHTHGVTTRVLGTTFSVRRYLNDSFAQVAVSSGRVSLRGRGASVTLSAGMVGRATDSTTAIVSANTDAGTFTDWALGRVTYRGVDVATMLASLERWTGYQFRLTDSALSARHITATFNVYGRTETLELLKHLLGVSMTIDGDIVTLRPAREARAPAARKTKSDHKFLSMDMEAGR